MTTSGSGKETKREKRTHRRPQDDNLSALLIPTPTHPLMKPKIAKPVTPQKIQKPVTNTNAPVSIKKEAAKKEKKEKDGKEKDKTPEKNDKKHAADASLSSSSQKPSSKKRKVDPEGKPGSRQSAREIARKEREEAEMEREVLEKVHALAQPKVEVLSKSKERNVCLNATEYVTLNEAIC